MSEAKHAAAYGVGGKDGAAADLSTRTLHDIYYRPWREYGAAGGRGAMLSHNSINDVPAHASAELMGRLRGWAKSDGMLLASDMCDVGLLWTRPGSHGGFNVAADLGDAAQLSMTAGMDQELCWPDDGRGQAFPLAASLVADGRLSQEALDRAAANVLTSKFAARLFERPCAHHPPRPSARVAPPRCCTSPDALRCGAGTPTRRTRRSRGSTATPTGSWRGKWRARARCCCRTVACCRWRSATRRLS